MSLPSDPEIPIIEVACPYLGTLQDVETHFQYPSFNNRCHRGPRAYPILEEYQEEVCLTADHKHCPVFLEDWDGVFPAEISGGDVVFPREKSRSKYLLFLVAAVVIVLVALLVVRAFSDRVQYPNSPSALSPVGLAETELSVSQENLVLEEATVTPSPEPTVTITPAPTHTPVPSSTSEPTATPTVSNTPMPTPGPGLETPFGNDARFIIHVVQNGESFTGIASQYDTTPDVLQAVNPSVEGALLWVGRQIVVPVGIDDPADLPVFEVYYATEATGLSTIAAIYNADVEEIRFYNVLGPGDEIPLGRWLIIPLPEVEK